MSKITPQQIIDYRTARNMTQAALARAVGVDVNTISRWERGMRTPRGLALKSLRAVLKNPSKHPGTGAVVFGDE